MPLDVSSPVQATLIFFLIINTVVWAYAQPLLVLCSFASSAVLILTLTLLILLGDGNGWTLTGVSLAVGG